METRWSEVPWLKELKLTPAGEKRYPNLIGKKMLYIAPSQIYGVILLIVEGERYMRRGESYYWQPLQA